jgi:ferrous iron transport protein A
VEEESNGVTIDLVLKMVFNFMKVTAKKLSKKLGPTLCDLAVGESGILEDFDMPQSIAEHLMNLGFVPGLEVFVARSGPGGNPRVYRVDGTEVALRRDLSRCIAVRPLCEAEMR